MSAFSDLLHSIVDWLPFHTEKQKITAHLNVDKAEEEIKGWVVKPAVEPGPVSPESVNDGN